MGGGSLARRSLNESYLHAVSFTLRLDSIPWSFSFLALYLSLFSLYLLLLPLLFPFFSSLDSDSKRGGGRRKARKKRFQV